MASEDSDDRFSPIGDQLLIGAADAVGIERRPFLLIARTGRIFTYILCKYHRMLGVSSI